MGGRSVTSVEENILRDFESHTIKQDGDPSVQTKPSGERISEDAVEHGLSFGSHGLTGMHPKILKLSCKHTYDIITLYNVLYRYGEV